jgi:O-antigen ligase/polysaccharide polymerase Wzy-like membrane protein
MLSPASMSVSGIAQTSLPPAQRVSWAHWITLALVALTIATSGIVFSEPAPVDVLMIGLIVLLPIVGLAVFNPTLIAFFSLWALAGAAAVLAATFSLDLKTTLTHVAVTVYLYLAAVVIAGFVAKNPIGHTRLIYTAWTWAAVAAGGAALAGYFGLLPGAEELFTKYGRASGTFKDPNVFGPFLVAPILYMAHVALERSWRSMIAPLAVAGFLALAVLLSFSRGAWMNLAAATAIYGYIMLLTSPRTGTRVKLVALFIALAIVSVGIVALALTSDTISNMLSERASLAQSYDTGPEGRFGGQEKAIALIAENPLGIGALEFSQRHHTEDVHNVYLSMMLNAGWLGGAIYWILVGLTLILGFRFSLKAQPTRPLFVIAYAAFVAVALEGLIVDTDHWRHFYLLMAIIWGLMSAPSRGAVQPSPQPMPHRERIAARQRAPSLLAPARRVHA